MSGETNLVKILATLKVERRPGVFAYVSMREIPPNVVADATVLEAEGTTLVVRTEVAADHGWPVAFEAVWLTLEVHSALDAVGLTAAVSKALADANIPCNVIAGAYHDHLLVPVAQAEAALGALESLRTG